LTGDLVAGVAVRKGVVVDGLFGVDLHVGLGGAAGVEVCDVCDYSAVFGGGGHGVVGVWCVVDILRVRGGGEVVRVGMRLEFVV